MAAQLREGALVRASITTQKAMFAAGEPIGVTLTLTNSSAASLTLVRPDWFFGVDPRQAARFVIERSDGITARAIPDCLTDNIGDTREKVAIDLAANATVTVELKMYACWEYAFGTDRIGHLGPGRYRVSVKYGFPAGTYSAQWWNRFSKGRGEPWHDEITSNTLEIVVQ
jgi:hypothetical protein